MSHVTHSSKETFEKDVLKSDLPVLVDFWAEWCGPCHQMAPALDELSEEMKGKLKIVKVNIEEGNNRAFVQEYELRGIPNMKLFKGGKVVEEFIGFMPKEDLAEGLEEGLKK